MKYILYSNYIFPFLPTTTIRFSNLVIDIEPFKDNEAYGIYFKNVEIDSFFIDLDFTGFAKPYKKTLENYFIECILGFISSSDSTLKIPTEEEIEEMYLNDIQLIKKTYLKEIPLNQYSSKDLNWEFPLKHLKLNKTTLTINPNICKEIYTEILKQVGLGINKEDLTPDECKKVKEFYATT